MLEPVFVKLGVYITASERISKANFINASHQSVCLYVYPIIVARQRLGKHVPSIPVLFGPRLITGKKAIHSYKNVCLFMTETHIASAKFLELLR
jgi:hypothetical protein